MLERDERALERARVSAGVSVLAHDLRQQTVHANGFVVHGCEAQARDRAQPIRKPLLLERSAWVDQDREQ
ncbi:MAG: hypothetical protein ACLPZR_33370 [Solirubrobacteraceae bacterium]